LSLKLRITKARVLYFCFAFLTIFAGCNSSAKTPNAETIRLYVRASDAYAQGYFAETAEILKTQNNFAPALVLRAKAEYFYGDLEKAEKTCRRAIKLRPSSLEAKLYLARTLRDKGDFEGAEKEAQTLLADNPQDIRALRFSAELAFDLGNFDEAVILLDKASEFSAESAMVLLDRARLRWIAGRHDETALKSALEDLSRARAMLPWNTPLLRSISNLENLINGVL